MKAALLGIILVAGTQQPSRPPASEMERQACYQLKDYLHRSGEIKEVKEGEHITLRIEDIDALPVDCGTAEDEVPSVEVKS
jgi:hypothetical protein